MTRKTNSTSGRAASRIRTRTLPAAGPLRVERAAPATVFSVHNLSPAAETISKIFSSLPLSIAYLNRYGYYIEVNNAFAELFHQSPDFFPGKNSFELDQRPENRAIFERVISQGVPHVSYSNPYSDPGHPERGITYWDWMLYPVIEPDGQVSGVIFTAQDVTARLKTEQALEHSRALFELIFESAPDANVLIDEASKIVMVNRQLELFFGYSRGELIGRPVEMLLPEPFCQTHAEYIANPQARSRVEGLELYARRQDGSEFPVQVMLSPFQTEKHLLVLASIRDLTAAKATEQSRLASEARMHAIFDNAPLGIQLLDESGNIIETNRVMQTMLGYTAEELMHMNFLGFTFQEDWRVNLSLLQKLLRREVPAFRLEKRYTRKDGSLFWGRLIVTRYDNETDGLHYLIAMVEDISDFKAAETARDLSEERFRASVESMLAGFAIFSCERDEQGRLVDLRYDFINEAGCRLNRHTREEHIGHTLLELQPRFRQTGLFEKYERVVETGEPFTIESFVMHDEHGSYRAYDVQAARLGDGLAIWWHETTARKQAQEALRHQEEMLRTVIETMPLGIWITDRDGVIQYANRAGREIWGNVPFAGRTWHTEMSAWWMASGTPIRPKEWGVYRAITLGETSIEEEIFAEVAGQRKTLLVSAAPIWDDKLAITGAILINQDITERKQMQAELAEVQRKLLNQAEEERLHVARELHDGPIQDLYGVSFRLNDLVTRLGQTSEAELAAQTRSELQRAITSLRMLMTELRPPTLAPFGLEKTIHSHAEQFQKEHPEISLHLQLAHDGQTLPEPVRLALFRIYQEALNNILRHAQASQVTVRFTFNRTQAEVTISDDGIGFTVPEHWVELARSGHYGLVGMRERAEALGGAFELRSTPGKGTRFHAVVPLRPD